MSRQISWTAAEVSRVVKLRAEGLTYEAIAATIPGLTGNAVCNKIKDSQRPREIIRAARLARAAAYALLHPRTYVRPDETPPMIEASEIFRVQLITAIDRFANDNGTDIDTAARFLLSGVAFG